jgi:hypothetical protein
MIADMNSRESGSMETFLAIGVFHGEWASYGRDDAVPGGVRGGGVTTGGTIVPTLVLNRPRAPYRYDTPYRALTLRRLIALIRYHAVPVTALPAHVADQRVPVTVAVTSTFVSVLIRARIVASPEGLVRRFAPQAAYLVMGAATALHREVTE